MCSELTRLEGKLVGWRGPFDGLRRSKDMETADPNSMVILRRSNAADGGDPATEPASGVAPVEVVGVNCIPEASSLTVLSFLPPPGLFPFRLNGIGLERNWFVEEVDARAGGGGSLT